MFICCLDISDFVNIINFLALLSFVHIINHFLVLEYIILCEWCAINSVAMYVIGLAKIAEPVCLIGR